MNIEDLTPILRTGELLSGAKGSSYFVKSLRQEIPLTDEEAELVALINGRRTFTEIAEAYCLRQGHLNFKNFFIQLNRVAAKAMIDRPENFSNLLSTYLKEGLENPEERYTGCYVTEAHKALRFQPERLKEVGGGLAYLEEIAHKIPLFEDLNPRDALAFFEHGRIRKFEKGDSIINKDDPGYDIYILLKGSASAYTEDGILTEMYAGSVFGETPYVFDLKRTASVKASDPVLALELNRTALRELEQSLLELRRKSLFETGEAEDSLGVVKKKFIINRIRLDQASFRGIHSSLVESFFSKAHVVNVPKGQRILAKNSLGREFYIIVAGQAEIMKDGQKVAHLYAGDYIGEISLFRDIPRTADALAATECSLLRIYKNDFFSLLCSNLRLALLIESNIDKRLAKGAPQGPAERPLPGKMLI